ncbi:MAG: hypothetical protein LBD88_04255 [Candidatus Peribacteria bacterium]|nr:hypothetical protein [Candidatus Peribacteria bacterium]
MRLSLYKAPPLNPPLSMGEILFFSSSKGEIWICSLCQKTPSNSPLSRGRF